MKDKRQWFDQKLREVPEAILEETRLSAGIICRIDEILKKKEISQRELARRLGKSEAVVSRWTTGFPNLTLRSIAQLSAALGEPIISITEDRS